MAKSERTIKKPNPVLTTVLAWAVPGAGHLYLGRPVRALILFLVIHLMFWSGIAIGGVFTVNPRDEFWWFNGQMLTGASGVASWYRQRLQYADVLAEANERLRQFDAGRPAETIARERVEIVDAVMTEKGLNPVSPDTIPFVLTGVAGMLNLMCAFDALMLSLMGRRGEPKRGGQP